MSAAVAAAASAACCSSNSNSTNSSSSNPSRTQNHYYYYRQYSLLNTTPPQPPLIYRPPVLLGRYESKKRRDWNTFRQYLSQHRPPLSLSHCSGADVVEFMKYLDQFGETKVHAQNCPFFSEPSTPVPCPCPFRQTWGSLDGMIGRLRAAFEENGGQPEMNPFGASAVRLYLKEVRDEQAEARGFGY